MAFLKELIQKTAFLFLSAEKKEVVLTLQEYANAFMTFEPENVVGYFDQPMMYLSEDGPVVFHDRGNVAAFLSSFMEELQKKEYARDDLSRFHIRALTTDVVVTSFHLVRVNRAGEAFGKYGAMYTWRKTNDSWKVVIGVLLSH